MPQLAKKWHRLHSKWGTAHCEAHTPMPRAREVWRMGRWPDPACWNGPGILWKHPGPRAHLWESSREPRGKQGHVNQPQGLAQPAVGWDRDGEQGGRWETRGGRQARGTRGAAS